ncbi:MAG: hypothetical protein ACRCW0_09150 [Clostridium sp.]
MQGNINTILNSSLVSALFGSLMGGLITWWVTSSSLKKQFNNERKIKRDEERKRLVSALIPIKNEIKSNTSNLYEFTKSINNGSIILPNDIFSLDKINKHIDVVELELGIELSDEILKISLSMKSILGGTKKENIDDVIEKGKKLQEKLENIIKENNEKIK